MKNSNDTIGNRTRDLAVCSAVPQSTEPPLGLLWAWIFVSCVYCVLSGRGLFDGLITRSEESYELFVELCVI